MNPKHRDVQCVEHFALVCSRIACKSKGSSTSSSGSCGQFVKTALASAHGFAGLRFRSGCYARIRTTSRNALILAALVMPLGACATIRQDEIGVKTRFGRVTSGPLKPGAQFVLPGVNSVLRVPPRIVNREADASVARLRSYARRPRRWGARTAAPASRAAGFLTSQPSRAE